MQTFQTERDTTLNQLTYEVPNIYQKLTKDRIYRVSVPGSKSLTNRALLLSTLATGTSTLKGVLFSDDSRHFLSCIQDLGFETTVDEASKTVTIKGLGGEVPLKEASQYVGSAGTAARFLTAYLGVSHGTYHMDASPQMRKRPMGPLLASLRDLGCEITCTEEEEHFPFTIVSNGFQKNYLTVDIGNSSQFLSALMIAAPLSPQDITIEIQGTHGMAYIEITRKMMEQFGVTARQTASNLFSIPAGQHYKALNYQIEPDVSGACYFYAMVPLLGISMKVDHVTPDIMQGDMEFLEILEKVGCTRAITEDGIVLHPPVDGIFKGITVDMSACSDQAITMAAIAPFADGPTTITGIGHIRFQECDRLTAIVTELRRMGIRCEETDSSITIYPGQPKTCTVQTYEDHRMAMGFTLTGLRSEGIFIDDPGCCRKTFENYYEVLESIVKEGL